jgi:hypothetical protein
MLKTALITVVSRQVSKDKSSIRATLLIRKGELTSLMKMSGEIYYIIPLDEFDKPDNNYRPIWLGPISREEALRRASLDPKCLGIVTMKVQVNGQKQTVFAVRAALSDVPQLRPIVTLSKQDASYIASQYKYEINPVPVGFDADNVKAIFQHKAWKIRPLLTKPGAPGTWIVACDQKPPQQVFCFEHGDIVVTEIIKNRSKSVNPQIRAVRFAESSKERAPAFENQLETKLDSFIRQQETINAATSSSSNPALERKLELFIQQQEIINNNVQTAIQSVQNSLGAVESRTLKVEEGLREVSGLKTHLDERFDALMALFKTSKSSLVVDIATPTKPRRSRSRGRSQSER